MKCKKCGHTGRVFRNNGSLLFCCDYCNIDIFISDKRIVKLYEFRQKLLNESNRSHNAFVFQVIHEQKRISTIELLQHCAAAYISNGDREARTLKTKGLLGNYKSPGERYVVWFEKSLVA